MMDRAVGGPGLRRGRRHPVDLRVGDGLDFWRVVAVEPPRRLLLLAEMKAPGDALLEFTLQPEGPRRVAGGHGGAFSTPRLGRHCLLVSPCSRPINGSSRGCSPSRVAQLSGKRVLWTARTKITVEDPVVCRL
jgi:hypothetical protein